MKQLIFCFLILGCSHFTKPLTVTNIYVSLTGVDSGKGTIENPFSNLNDAIRKARELRRLKVDSISGGITIIVGGGVYKLKETIFINPDDAGTNESPTIIKAAIGELPILSGGVNIENWKLSSRILPKTKGKIWEAKAPKFNGKFFEFRQLWVNNKKAIRAQYFNGDFMNRILSWNKADQTCMIPTPTIKNLNGLNGLEMFIHQWWQIAVLRIKKVQYFGDSTKLFFEQPESKLQSEHPWPAPFISKETGNSAFNLVNAIEFLDEPGEWFLDNEQQKVYYYPMAGENISTTEIIAPALETLVSIKGNESKSVSNIEISGLSFEHSTWLRPSQKGHIPHQVGMFMVDAYKIKNKGTSYDKNLDNLAWVGRPAAAVEINYGKNIKFSKCKFQHLASTGLDFNKGSNTNTIEGNLFKDIGGNGILGGVFSDETDEIHMPYNPNNKAEICDSLLIKNNLITNATNEDWGCVGIGIGCSRNTIIEHNEIENVGYTGISIGWGWSKMPRVMMNNIVRYNEIKFFGKSNYDCGGIYMLSAQPNSTIKENYVDSAYRPPYVHNPSHWFYLYTDAGSMNTTVSNNWAPSKKFIDNTQDKKNIWDNNGPHVDIKIKNNAGLEAEYNFLNKEKIGYKKEIPINEEHLEIIEIILPENDTLDMALFNDILERSHIKNPDIRQWRNHILIYSLIEDLMVTTDRLKKYFPKATVKVYYDLVYNFQKKNNCSNKSVVKEWDHIILTANLVDDIKLQKEYINAHLTQFEKIPQIAEGFCNANFQQLQVFKSGRQLMLVISIPKGESLDKLNPKTTENNPQMIEWNKQMSKYQEGIEGTKNGETWVFLKKLNDQ